MSKLNCIEYATGSCKCVNVCRKASKSKFYMSTNEETFIPNFDIIIENIEVKVKLVKKIGYIDTIHYQSVDKNSELFKKISSSINKDLFNPCNPTQ